MILRSVTLKHVRGYRDEQTVTLDARPFHLVEGENGAGKSTLAEAVRAVLTLNHDSKAESTQKLRPRGAALAPEITITFEHDGALYRLWKRFLDRPRALLEKRAPDGGFRPQSEGKQADRDALALLGGPSAQDRLALLFASQDGLEIELSGDILNDIRTSLGGQMAGRQGTRFEKLAEDQCEEYYTPGRGLETGELKKARAGVQAAEIALTESRHLLEQLEDSRQTAAEARRSAAEAAAELARLAPCLEQAEAVEADANNLANEYRTAQATLNAAEASWKELHERTLHLKAALAELETLNTKSATLENAAAGTRAAADTALAGAAQARNACEALNRPEPGFAAQLEAVRQARRQLQSDLRSQLTELQAPTPGALAEIRERLAAAQAQLETRQFRVEFTPERPLTLEVLQGEPLGPQTLEAGRKFVARGQGSIVLSLPGTGTLTLSGPLGETAGIEAEIHRLEADRAGAERRIALAAPLHSRLQDLETEIRLDPVPPELEAARQEREKRKTEAFHLWQQAEVPAKQADTLAVQAASAWKHHQNLLADATRRLGVLQDSYTAPQREEELARRARDRDRARTAFDELDRARKALPADAVEQAANLRRRRDDLQRKRDKAARDLRDEEVRQRTILQDSPYTKYAQAEESLHELRSRLAALELRAHAARLLWSTLQDCRTQALAGLSEPVAARATQLLEHIAGKPLARIQLDRDFAADGVLPEDSREPAAIDDMSAGEQEQIWAATRLALADILAGDAPQTVVFDDVFARTDAARLARILELLHARRDRMQFIILTCHPERYAPLENAARHPIANCRLL